MQSYDAVLKRLLTSSSTLMERLTQTRVQHWLNVELPRIQHPRVDLLGETTEGHLVHIELQSRNDPNMAWHIGMCR